jgi:hypothetical protein
VSAHRTAIAKQRSALEQFPQAAEYREQLGQHYLHLAALQRDLSRPTKAVATSLERRQLWPHNANELYEVARELALCIPLVAKGQAELSAQEHAERQRYADQALETLRQAVREGFADRDRLQNEPDLAPPRSSAEFQKLLQELD